MKINSTQNNSQNFQGGLTFVNLSKRGRSEGVKSTFRKTTDKFDKQLLAYINKYLVPELKDKGYASESTINELNKVLNKINITLPSSYGNMIYCKEWKNGKNCFVEIPSKFRINLRSKFTKHILSENKSQKPQDKFTLQNYNRGGKKTVRETSPEFDNKLIDFLNEIIKKYPAYIIPIDKIKDLEKILRKINITLPLAHMAKNGTARFWGKVDDKNNCVFEILDAFRINLNA